MKRHDIESLDDHGIFDACFTPLIMEYKKKMAKENSAMVKERFYAELTTGQKALFTFHMYYDHAIESQTEFYWWSAYFMAQPKIWSAIKLGLQYFEDDSMYLLIQETEKVLQKHHCPNTLEAFAVKREDLDQDFELSESINSLYFQFSELSDATITKISHYIRGNQEAF
ncbi:hypothetical protein SAMN05880501_108130 [Ureibacillus xyleni]|uniref:DUF4375 domain-containing protein n=1 Tax=Ureibacillus xyleni TaxID=614648 RepID=A0A285T850_9BACL|nr:hypothetical protein [Ureibacillus xyleni]SOC15703.1 hypothetical protein SAMN05880501_108130 [Ureibacillus xyleni]